MDKKFTKKIKKMMFKNLDSVYNGCEKVADEWDTKGISLTFLKKAIDVIRPNDLDKEPKLKEFMTEYDKTMFTLYKTCEAKSHEMRSNKVSLKYLKTCIEKVKTSFESAL